MNGLARVALRELHRLPRFPVLWALLGPIPLTAGLLLTGVFQAEVARKLPIGVLDFDASDASRQAARWVNAARTTNVVARVQDLGQAQELLVERKVYGVLVIPRHFERDVLRGRSPGVTLLYNEQYLTAGNLIAADVSRALNGASSGPPIRVDSRLLFNPAINYARGVGLVLIVGVIQIVAGLSAVYVVGRELKDSTAGEWLAAAEGSVPIAWIGKLGPYVLYDLLLTLLLVGGFVAWFHIPVLGNLGMLGLGALAFSLASKAIGVLLTVLPANLRQGLGVGSILFGPAVAFSGVTFPRIAMSTFAQVWGGLVPLTRFMLVIRDQVLVGAPLRVSIAPILALAAIALGAGLLSLPRMRRVLQDPRLWGLE